MNEVNNIPEGWVETTLGEVVTFQRGFDLPTTNRTTGNFPLMVSNGQDGTHNEFKVKAPGVVTGRSGSLGNVYFVNKNFWPLNTTLWVKDFYNNDVKFVYYFLKTFQFEKYNSGSGVPTLNRNHIHPITIIFPKDLSEQKSIADILTSFDDKIELLQAQNKTLEELAQTLFKEWFGKYKVGDELPEGWRVGKLEEVIEFINGYAFKSNDILNEPEIETLKVFKMGDIKKGGGFNPSKTKSYFRKKDAKKLSKYILRNGDLLMCMTDMKDAISLLGHTALMIYDDEYIVNQRVGLIRAKNDINISYPYLYLLTNEANFISDLRGRSNSGVQVNLSTEAIKQSNIVIADKDTNLKFNIIVKPLFDKVKTNTEQIQTLTKTRDALLPKLMSGEIRVKKQFFENFE